MLLAGNWNVVFPRDELWPSCLEVAALHDSDYGFVSRCNPDKHRVMSDSKIPRTNSEGGTKGAQIVIP